MPLLQRSRTRRHPRVRALHDWTRAGGTKEFDWAASGWAGLAGGSILLLWETALAPLFLGLTPAAMARRVAAIALGEQVLALDAFSVLVAATAFFVHLPLSLVYARLLSALVHRMRARSALFFGAAFGAALYFVNFHGFTALFPWFEPLRGWSTLLGHMLYGASAAAVYEGLLNAKD